MMSELNAGDMVYVSDVSEEHALEMKYEYELVFDLSDNPRYKGDYPYCVLDGEGETVYWSYAVKVPEKKVIPLTFETFPKGVVWAREKSITSRSIVHYIDDEYASFGGSNFTYSRLMDECEISLDGGETWQPAGIEEE